MDEVIKTLKLLARPGSLDKRLEKVKSKQLYPVKCILIFKFKRLFLSGVRGLR